MGTNIVFNGITYTIPATNDVAWGSSVTGFLTAIPGGVLAKTGGAWHLTAADLDLGGTNGGGMIPASGYGIAARYYKSNSVDPISSTGVLRLSLTDLITWRKDGSSDYRLGVGSGNIVSGTNYLLPILDKFYKYIRLSYTIPAGALTVNATLYGKQYRS